MVLMTCLFFLFGSVTNFNDVLMPYPTDGGQLAYLFLAHSRTVGFFSTYFLVSRPTGGVVLQKLGYQRGM